MGARGAVPFLAHFGAGRGAPICGLGLTPEAQVRNLVPPKKRLELSLGSAFCGSPGDDWPRKLRLSVALRRHPCGARPHATETGSRAANTRLARASTCPTAR